MALSTEKQAEELKEKGNLYFKKEKLGAAIEAYTEAITLCPDIAVYWTNRALCHRKRDDWEHVEADCRKALELEGSVKAHYLLGLALLQKKQYDEATKQLQRALDLGRGVKPTSNIVDEIWAELSRAKYSEWESISSARRRRQTELGELCKSLIRAEHEKEVRRISQKLSNNSGYPEVVDIHDESQDVDNEFLQDEKVKLDLARVHEKYQERLGALDEVFSKASVSDTPAEVPDYLCCQITTEIFKDPVVTPSGVTYERAVLLEHLRKVGKFDPVTRAPLQPDQLVPNLAIKEAVQAYLAEHGWAYRT